MRRVLIEFLALLALLMVTAIGMVVIGDHQYNQGYLNGQAAGIHSGYRHGERDGYTIGYTKGQTDQSSTDVATYQSGYSAGQQDFSDFYDYLINSCAKDYSGYYQVVVYRSSSNGSFHYTCIA